MAGKLKAVVVGGTGAVGREVVGQLLESSKWGQVVTVGRRPVEVPAHYKDWDKAKLKQVTVDMDKLEEQAQDAFKGADSVFCALGTTRGVAGSAEAFRRVELDYVVATARAAKSGGVPHFSLVSAMGANAGVWACDLKPFHALLYTKTKGQAEEAVRALDFDYFSIMQPGLIDRGDLTRGIERVFAKFASSVPAAQVARAMVGDAESYHAAVAAVGKDALPREKVWSMKDLKQYWSMPAKAAAAAT